MDFFINFAAVKHIRNVLAKQEYGKEYGSSFCFWCSGGG